MSSLGVPHPTSLVVIAIHWQLAGLVLFPLGLILDAKLPSQEESKEKAGCLGFLVWTVVCFWPALWLGGVLLYIMSIK